MRNSGIISDKLNLMGLEIGALRTIMHDKDFLECNLQRLHANGNYRVDAHCMILADITVALSLNLHKHHHYDDGGTSSFHLR